MKSIKQLLKPLYVRFSVLKTCGAEYCYLVRHLCTSNTYDKKEKLRYSLLLQCHIVEKGMSLSDVRFGFGVPKITRLLKDLESYYNRYSDQETLFFVLSIIKAYIVFHNSNSQKVNDKIIRLFNSLEKKLNSDTEVQYQKYRGGVIATTKQQILGTTFPYEDFVKTRHSIRTFTGEPIPKEIICKALGIAETTPSACNRQPWNIYVRTRKENIIKLLDLQTGARQFKEKVSGIVIIASTANAFSITEGHQLYLNSGLYAMNLMLAFHSLGIGTIPLNLGIGDKRLGQLKKELAMPSDSVPVLMIAIGQIADNLKVACSRRFSFTEYTNFD